MKVLVSLKPTALKRSMQIGRGIMPLRSPVTAAPLQPDEHDDDDDENSHNGNNDNDVIDLTIKKLLLFY